MGLKENAPTDSLIVTDDFDTPSGLHVSAPDSGLNHSLEGMNGLHMDGHVMWMPHASASHFHDKVVEARKGQSWGPGYGCLLVD